ncbi:hypothetical protein DERP_000740 [Dermatophagoides pteronyssinus]|uniref:Uncharacterized protein n=1 Tax=Dermatophagoides pteronyssinus TaxID=6956 RepID=A0ABQ8J102_DERPT|nr:hypothetical protein DERP_000740 [Dermatophagoides pteronyssinus]
MINQYRFTGAIIVMSNCWLFPNSIVCFNVSTAVNKSLARIAYNALSHNNSARFESDSDNDIISNKNLRKSSVGFLQQHNIMSNMLILDSVQNYHELIS